MKKNLTKKLEQELLNNPASAPVVLLIKSIQSQKAASKETVEKLDGLKEVLAAILEKSKEHKNYNGEGLENVTENLAIINDTLKAASATEQSNTEEIVAQVETLQKAFEFLEKAIFQLATKETPAPIVNVDAPVINVPEPKVITKQDPFSEVIAKTLLQILQKQDGQTYIANRAPSEAIPVVLTDKSLKSFYNAISQIVTSQQAPLNPDYSIMIDEASATITYVGYADPGVSEDNASWKIKRIDTSVAGQTKIKWAGGVPTKSNAWSDRASLIYS